MIAFGVAMLRLTLAVVIMVVLWYGFAIADHRPPSICGRDCYDSPAPS